MDGLTIKQINEWTGWAGVGRGTKKRKNVFFDKSYIP